MRKLVYIAHPLGSEKTKREANRKAASRWVAFLAEHFEIAPVADWIVLSGEWPETEEMHALGLTIDLGTIEHVHELWLVGPEVSPGMAKERDYALMRGLPVKNLVGLACTLESLPELEKRSGHGALRRAVAAPVTVLDPALRGRP